MNHSSEEPLPILVIKYGGNAMRDQGLQAAVLSEILKLKARGFAIVLVHGGGPFIQKALDQAQLSSRFIDGHRQTSAEAYAVVEMALKGQVNGQLVSILNRLGGKAVGLSGKDGSTVIARKRQHYRQPGDPQSAVDLGRVGDVAQVQPALILSLLDQDYLPVITCVADDEKGEGYNINADLFAGHLAGALGAASFIVLTDVDGLLRDIEQADSLISQLALDELADLRQAGLIKGGMIPKIEACETALKQGAASARIINGTKAEHLRLLAHEPGPGTLLKNTH